jgi:Holliday junction resolvase
MSSPSKAKGNTFEREIVKQAQALGFKAERAWGSNGRSKGWHEEVDVVISTLAGAYSLQCKRRAKLAKFIRPTEHVDAQVIREDRGETFVIFPLAKFFEILTLVQGELDENRGDTPV